MEMMVASGDPSVTTTRAAPRTYGSSKSNRARGFSPDVSRIQSATSSNSGFKNAKASSSKVAPSRQARPKGLDSLVSGRQSDRVQIRAALKLSLAEATKQSSPRRINGQRKTGKGQAILDALSSDSDLSSDSPPPKRLSPRRTPPRNGDFGETATGDDEVDEEIPELADFALPGPSTPPSAAKPMRTNRDNPIRLDTSPLTPTTSPYRPLSSRNPPTSPDIAPMTPSKRGRDGRSRLQAVVEIPTRSSPKSTQKSHVSDTSPLSSAPASASRSEHRTSGRPSGRLSARQRIQARLQANDSSPLSSPAPTRNLREEGSELRRSPRKQRRMTKAAGDTSADPLDVMSEDSSALSDAPDEDLKLGSLSDIFTRDSPGTSRRAVSPPANRKTQVMEVEDMIEVQSKEKAADRLRRQGKGCLQDIKRSHPARPPPPPAAQPFQLNLSPASSELSEDEGAEEEAEEEEGEGGEKDEDETEADDEDEEDDGDEFVLPNNKKPRPRPSKSPIKRRSPVKPTPKKGKKARDGSPALSQDGLKKSLSAKEKRRLEAMQRKREKADADFWALQNEDAKERREEQYVERQNASLKRTQEEYEDREKDDDELSESDIARIGSAVHGLHENSKALKSDDLDVPSEYEDFEGEDCQFCQKPLARIRFPGMFHWLLKILDQRRDRKRVGSSVSDYCETHHLESLGLFKFGKVLGYPENIDFVDIPARLETSWIKKELKEIGLYPSRSSPIFRAAAAAKDTEGSKWRNIASKLTCAGYYGSIGESTILDHLNWVDSAGRFSTIHPTDAQPYPTCTPLTGGEFLRYVLVPEASILLIMQDRGWRDDKSVKGAEFDVAREATRGIWKASREYGKWAWFGADEADIRRKIFEWRETRPKKGKKPKDKTVTAIPVESDFGSQPNGLATILQHRNDSLSPPPAASPTKANGDRSRRSNGLENARNALSALSSSSTRSAHLNSPPSQNNSAASSTSPAKPPSGRPRRSISNRSLQKTESFGDADFPELGEDDIAHIEELEKKSASARRKK